MIEYELPIRLLQQIYKQPNLSMSHLTFWTIHWLQDLFDPLGALEVTREERHPLELYTSCTCHFALLAQTTMNCLPNFQDLGFINFRSEMIWDFFIRSFSYYCQVPYTVKLDISDSAGSPLGAPGRSLRPTGERWGGLPGGPLCCFTAWFLLGMFLYGFGLIFDMFVCISLFVYVCMFVVDSLCMFAGACLLLFLCFVDFRSKSWNIRWFWTILLFFEQNVGKHWVNHPVYISYSSDDNYQFDHVFNWRG